MRLSYHMCVGVMCCAAVATADDSDQPRAKPPEWPRDVKEVFFDDAREQLVGERPNYGELASQPRPASVGRTPANDGREARASQQWSQLVTADVLETEIKRQLAPLQPLVATPNAFKGGGYRDCRTRFTWLATLFTVAGNYDGQVRWQDTAPALGQLFARAAANCKVGTDQSYRESQLRAQDLADLVRGSRPDAPDAKPDVTWDEIADFSPLMKRMEQGLGRNISPNISDERSMDRNAEDLGHEAQLMAVLAEVLVQPGYGYEEDEVFLSHAHQLRDGATALHKAIDLESFEAARAALGEMQKACSNCHDEYR